MARRRSQAPASDDLVRQWRLTIGLVKMLLWSPAVGALLYLTADVGRATGGQSPYAQPAPSVTSSAGGPSRVASFPVRGAVRPLHQATISTDLVARVARIGFRDGEAFRRNDVLLAFDCRRQQAELAAAEAQHQEMKITLETNTFLEKRNAASRQDLEVAKARAAKAAAEADGLRVRMDQCTIVAPFDGRLFELAINEHEMSQPGKPLLSIVGDGELEIDLIVPSDWLGWLGVGAPFSFAIDETARTHAARVVRIGAAVDTVSQTIKVTGRFDEADRAVLAGMSGAALFSGSGK
jgi:RND family efflux transporter MFP subunit